MNPYSDLKVAWHSRRLEQMRGGGQIVPAQVQLIISDLCNQDCSFCAYRMTGYTSNQHFGEMTADGFSNNPKRFIPTEKAGEILRDAAAMGVEAVQFTGGGEPTVHPDHLDIFQYAMERGLEAALVTNGAILRDGWRDVLPRMSWLRVSLDAGKAETYAAIRRVPESTWTKVLHNLEMLSGACRESGTTIGTSFIITRANVLDMARAARAAREAGAESIRFAAMFSPALDSYYDGQLTQEALEGIEMARAFENDGFKVLDMFRQRVGDLMGGAPDYAFCGYQQFNVYIGGDLNVYRCCNTAYNDLGLVGSLKEQTFRSFWESEAKRQAYGTFDARACQHCAFNGKNRLINGLVHDRPQHLAFV